MEIHNSTEDMVLAVVNDIFDAIEREGKEDRPCTCYQCRLDTACYVLNRTTPKYVVSSRGAARAENVSLVRQQEDADIATLVYEGLHKIAHSMRPHFDHNPQYREAPIGVVGPVFNLPTIIGRVFNGVNFEPLNDIDVELRCAGQPAEMIGPNWQNPYHLIPNTAGTFTFWPKPVSAVAVGTQRLFEFGVIIVAAGYEDFHHFFDLTVLSEDHAAQSFSMQRTYKLPDLYLFPPSDDVDE